MTCADNAPSYAQSDFTKFASADETGTIFDRTSAQNPVADRNFVFVPYCTGDLHGGNVLDGVPFGTSGPQQYVGYVDMKLALARIVPGFPSISKVILSGVSAGGAGVTINYIQTVKAFGGVPVYALDDSGPPMPDPYLATCLNEEWGTLFRFDRTLLADCNGACGSGTPMEVMAANLSMHPTWPFGVVDSTADKTISNLYDYGTDSCMYLSSEPTTPFPSGMLLEGHDAARTALASYPNYGSFLFTGTDHTTLRDSSAYLTRATGEGLLLTTWIGALVNGTVTNAGP